MRSTQGEQDMMQPPHADAILRRPSSQRNLLEILLNMRSAQDIERAQRSACIAGGVAALTQLLLPLAQLFLSSGATSASILMPLHVMSAVILLGLVYGVVRTSRISSLALVGFYMLTQLYQWRGLQNEGLELMGGLLALTLLFFMVRGVQATFAFHRMERHFDTWQRTMDSTLDPRLFDEE